MKPDLSNKTDSTAAVLITAAVLCLSAHSSTAAYPSAPEIRKSSLVVALEDYAVAPLSSRTLLEYPPRLNPAGPLARINFLRQEAVLQGMPHQRFFVCDLNRNLYILDPTQREFVPYINFEEVFGRFDNNPGYAGGLVTFAFDPDYASNGRFFTSHTEDPLKPGPVIITNGSLPGLSLAAYSASPSVDPPVGDVVRHAVVIEWTDLNVSNSSFEGTAREILRIGFSGNVHPVGDMLFNPTARRGDPDWGNLYIACGDGGAGESPDERHHLPQRLDALQGKILRITPDLGLRPDDLLSANGRYRIPSANLDQNPFLNRVSGNFRPEIYALGFRNPHRLAWSPELGGLLTSDIGLNSWEEVNLVRKADNHGYAEREGPEQLFIGGDVHGRTGSQVGIPFPEAHDELRVPGLDQPLVPRYPVLRYSHWDGDAIAGGFVYRGTAIPPLQGKFVFADITTGRIFISDVRAMKEADGGGRRESGTIEELRVSQGGLEVRVFDLLSREYRRRGGTSRDALPGGCGGLATSGADSEGLPYGCGRADVRIAEDAEGELYLLSKSDGVIRKLAGTAVPVQFEPPKLHPQGLMLRWRRLQGITVRLQTIDSLGWGQWRTLDVPVVQSGGWAESIVPRDPGDRFYRLQQAGDE
ncbi:MAG: PQQ-dependent sugar dehydrogenase [Verrucomicrobia bacterium]|nr:PQQ-dependent sugar dehydrogenase [Verrucomicrobiota bacterium]